MVKSGLLFFKESGMQKQMFYTFSVLLIAVLLTGCETAKSTISGPFIGMEKDAQNISAATGKAVDSLLNDGEEGKQRGTIRRVDDWMQKNMW